MWPCFGVQFYLRDSRPAQPLTCDLQSSLATGKVSLDYTYTCMYVVYEADFCSGGSSSSVGKSRRPGIQFLAGPNSILSFSIKVMALCIPATGSPLGTACRNSTMHATEAT